MKEENFKKGIEEIQEMRLAEAEKSAILQRIFSTPIRSPYTRYLQAFAYVRRPASALVVVCLIFAFSSVTDASQNSLPGEKLYSLKVAMVEPILDHFNTAPLEKLAWEEEKISRRIAEAESLADQNKLDEKKTKELEDKIEKSSSAFAITAEVVASSTATSTNAHREKVERLKREFKHKLEADRVMHDDEEKDNKKQQKGDRDKEAKIKRLKDTAVRAVDSAQNRERIDD